ncbi:hypothetical protein [Leminorella grimontii]|uniref:hypothetical protein n=1 Tax=Leminorella grimontii TaxID=82981 RepID=UPI0021C3CEC7|nr:hypothetical protein [Leminorella grimontii]
MSKTKFLLCCIITSSTLFASTSSIAASYRYTPELPLSCRAVAEFMTEPFMIAEGENFIPKEMKGKSRDQQRKWMEKTLLGANKSDEDCLLFLTGRITKVGPDKMMPLVCLQHRALFKERLDAKGRGDGYTNIQMEHEDAMLYRLKAIKGEKVLKNFCSYAVSTWQANKLLTLDDYRKLQSAYPLPQPCENNLAKLEPKLFDTQAASDNDKKKKIDMMSEMLIKRVYNNTLFGKDSEAMAKKCQKVGELINAR